jgi:hypothetical protein
MGVMLDGVLMLNQNNALGQDPFYPVVGAAPDVDQCLSHAAPMTGDYHYHSMSPCVLSSNYPVGPVTICSSNADCALGASAQMVNGLTNYHNLTVVGVGRDGHLIYGPFNSTGQRVTNLDVCNGMRDCRCC